MLGMYKLRNALVSGDFVSFDYRHVSFLLSVSEKEIGGGMMIGMCFLIIVIN